MITPKSTVADCKSVRGRLLDMRLAGQINHRSRITIRWLAYFCFAANLCALAAVPGAFSQVIRTEDARELYIRAIPQDAVSRLQSDMDSGRVKLAFDSRFGYLPAVLRALHLSTTSQVAVFSKTSVQKDLISPETPRSLYFNDSTYVGYVTGARALEVCTSEPYLGAVYYTLLQREVDKPRFFRTINACLECHTDKSFTRLPEHFMYSSYCANDGSVLSGRKPMPISDSTPLAKRFGGWYVTGDTSNQKHLGNIFSKNGEQLDFENRPFVGLRDLSKVIDTKQLLTPYSDIVALMTFGHQQRLLNLISGASYQTNSALALDRLRKQRTTADRSSNTETVTQVVKRVCEPVVAGLLFANEAKLNGAISGESGFASFFSSVGSKDRRGRSLRTFDLHRRLFLYPCSYLIYSASFDALPQQAKQYIYRRLWKVLTERDSSGRFPHLSPKDRKAIREILTDTKPEFAANRQE